MTDSESKAPDFRFGLRPQAGPHILIGEVLPVPVVVGLVGEVTLTGWRRLDQGLEVLDGVGADGVQPDAHDRLCSLCSTVGVTVTIEIEATTDDGFADDARRTVGENARTLKFETSEFEA